MVKAWGEAPEEGLFDAQYVISWEGEMVVRARCHEKRDLFAYVFVEIDPRAVEIGEGGVVSS